MRLLIRILALAISLDTVGSAKEMPPRQITSPHNTSAVKIEHRSLPGSDPANGFFTIVVKARGETVGEYPTMGYLLDAFWSTDERYVAVNNRRSNAGDYLWVFSVADGKALRMPNDDIGAEFASRATKNFRKLAVEDFEKFVNTAKRWITPAQLEVQTQIIFHGLTGAVILRRAVYQIEGHKLVLKAENFEKVPSAPQR